MKLLTILNQEDIDLITDKNTKNLINNNAIEIPNKVTIENIRRNIIPIINEQIEDEYDDTLERLGM